MGKGATAGEFVYLRPIDEGDLETIFLGASEDEEGRRLTGTRQIFTRESVEAAYRRFWQDPDRVDMAVCRIEDDRVVGEVVLNQVDAYNRSANFRIAIYAGFRGRGYGTEATRLMLDYGFRVRNLHRIELEVWSQNPRAAHVYETVGFRREGVRRQSWLDEGRYYDSWIMGILAHEFES